MKPDDPRSDRSLPSDGRGEHGWYVWSLVAGADHFDELHARNRLRSEAAEAIRPLSGRGKLGDAEREVLDRKIVCSRTTSSSAA